MRKHAYTIKRTLWVMICLLAAVMSGCISSASADKEKVHTETVEVQAQVEPVVTATVPDIPTADNTAPAEATPTTELEWDHKLDPTPTKPVKKPSPATPSPVAQKLDPAQWKEWPIIPVVSPEMREIYQQGLAAGNNPHSFSILGDCQSQPDVFMGVFDHDVKLINRLSENLKETVKNFTGSFDRYSPTVKDGTTEGALLWEQWNDNKEKKCNYGETPLECELRVNKPSIVFIHVGTHWEGRNRVYLNKIIDQILEQKAVPVLVTKADNRELDERVNRNYTEIAAERGLPMWNFWASVQHLPQGGMKDDMYLSDEALIIHRNGALDALDAVWRFVR